ncbi:MAG TPA: CAP domain-containing protein [Gemmatimonadaceae bacterium]|nr:CAP domain-containing protein [Gemmatimonadaceae bacterium]
MIQRIRAQSPNRRHRRSKISRAGFGRLLVTHIRQAERSWGARATKGVLALLLCAAFAFLLPTTASTRPTPANRPAHTAVPMSLDGMAREIVYLVNIERAEHALPPLRINDRLTADAKLQAAQIAETGVLDHVILSGPYPTPRERAEAAGYNWNVLGENLALGYSDAPSAVAAWMRSPGHRANILAGSYSETGVVLAPDARGRLIFVQTFGAPE